MAMQLCLERVAAELGMPHSRVCEINLYRDGDTHPCGQLLEGLQVGPRPGVRTGIDSAPLSCECSVMMSSPALHTQGTL